MNHKRRLRKLETAETGPARLYVVQMHHEEPDQGAIARRLIADAGYPPPTPADLVVIVREFDERSEPRFMSGGVSLSEPARAPDPSRATR